MAAQTSVAFFMHDFSGGGVERMRLAIAGKMAARGYLVSIVVVSSRGPLAKEIPTGVSLVDLHSSRAAFAILKLRQYLQRQQPDILISSLDHNNVVALCASAWCGTSTRLIICQHNALSEEIGLGWKYRVIPFLYWLFHRKAAGIIAVSNGVADDLAAVAHLRRDTVTTIPNPVVDPPRFTARAELLPHCWFGDPATPVFVFAGRLVPQKDPIALLDIFERRLKSGAARLIILGDGPLREEMMGKAKQANILSCIHFAGYVKDPTAWIRCADALLLTSRYEGFGNVIVEALACGTPVVAMDCPYGPSEILAGGTFGRLIKPGDLDAFAKALIGSLRTQFPASMLRARGQQYTVERTVDMHEALFARVLNPATRRAFGLCFTHEDAATIAARCVESDSGNRLRLIVTPNVDQVRLLQQPKFLAACIAADTVCADGWPVALFSHLRSGTPMRRVTGCDILHTLMNHSQLASRRIFVVAESNKTASQLDTFLHGRGLADNWQVAIAPENLGGGDDAQVELAASINSFKPDVLILTLGAPVSEVFVCTNRAALPPCWALCIGQALRVEIGLTKRAPHRWRDFGLEWAWRCTQEPRRLGLRYVKGMAWFPWAILRDIIAIP